MVAVEIGQAREKFPIRALGLAQRSLSFHIDGLVLRLAFAFYRADFHAETAARAVFRRNLQRIAQGFQTLASAAWADLNVAGRVG